MSENRVSDVEEVTVVTMCDEFIPAQQCTLKRGHEGVHRSVDVFQAEPDDFCVLAGDCRRCVQPANCTCSHHARNYNSVNAEADTSLSTSRVVKDSSLDADLPHGITQAQAREMATDVELPILEIILRGDVILTNRRALIAAREIALMFTAARDSERDACKKDVCMYCSGRAPDYESAVGPNSAGNYTHEVVNKARLYRQGVQGIVLCAASSIFVRERYAATQRTGGSGITTVEKHSAVSTLNTSELVSAAALAASPVDEGEQNQFKDEDGIIHY